MDKTTKSINASAVVSWYAPQDRKDCNDATAKNLRACTGVQKAGRWEFYRVDGHAVYGSDVSLVIGRTTLVSLDSIEKNYTRVDPPDWAKPAPAPVTVAELNHVEPTMADLMKEVVALRKLVEVRASADARGQLPLIKAS